MPRRHLVELEDLPWLPAPVREAATGQLQTRIHQGDAFAPAVRPFRLPDLRVTYLIPLVPIVVRWDGIVSWLRTYSVEELRALVAEVPGRERSDWSIGEAAGRGPLPMLYLVGTPRGAQTPAA